MDRLAAQSSMEGIAPLDNPLSNFTGAFWFDGADYEEVPLLNVGEAAGLDIFDAFLLQQQSREQRGAAQEAQQSGEASAQAAQQQEPQHPGLPAAEQQEPARQKKPKKKPLSRAEKARIEREKNREIQARYRQRQKEKKEALLLAHEEAATDLERLRAEHAALRERNDAMEVLLRVREEEVGILEAAKLALPPSQEEPAQYYDPQDGSFWGGSPDGEGGSAGAQQPGVPAALITELSGSESKGGRHSMAQQEEEEEGEQATSAEGGEESGSEPEGGSHAAAAAAGTAAGRGHATQPAGDVRALWQPGEAHVGAIAVPREVIERARSMSPEEYISNWEGFSRTLRDVLQRYDLTKNPQTLDDLEPLLKRRAVVMTLMLHHNPHCVKTLFVRSGDRTLSDEVQEAEYWDSLVASMQITPQQRERYAAMWESYMRKVERLRARRENALTIIRQAYSCENLATAGGLGGMMQHYLQIVEGAASLSTYPDSQFVALLELLSECGRILTPLQKARMVGLNYPHFPDVLQIMRAIMRLPRDGSIR